MRICQRREGSVKKASWCSCASELPRWRRAAVSLLVTIEIEIEIEKNPGADPSDSQNAHYFAGLRFRKYAETNSTEEDEGGKKNELS